MFYLTALIPVLLFVYSISPAQCEPYWSYDLISVDVENHTPDVAIIDLHETRLARGIYTFAGEIVIKQNLTDKLLIGITTYYSMTGQNYIKAAFFVNDCKLSDCLRIYYPLVQADFEKCCENLPIYGTNIELPIKPCHMKCNNCTISNEELPSRLRNGFYKTKMEYKNQVKSIIIFTVEVFDK